MPALNAFQPLSQTLAVPCQHGLHLRVAAQIVTLANSFRSSLWLSSRTRSANAKSILSLMELGLAEGDPVTVTARGPDAQRALTAIRVLFEDRVAICGQDTARPVTASRTSDDTLAYR